MRDPEFTHPVRITMRHNDDIMAWDEVCYKSIDLFGLPGDRYITDISTEWMDWIFKDPKDALIFKLKFSEVTV